MVLQKDFSGLGGLGVLAFGALRVVAALTVGLAS